MDDLARRIHELSAAAGDILPTVREFAVDLSINPNTVSRAYTELKLTGLVETQMGSGTFVGNTTVERDQVEQEHLLEQLCQEFLSRVSTHGFTLDEVLQNLEQRRRRREEEIAMTDAV